MYGFSELPGGLRVVTARMPHLSSVALGIWTGTGGRFETVRQNGVAHFIEHMLFKGTRRRSAARISQDVEGIGGYLNAFTDEEHTCFYSRALASKLPELADVLLDMFLDSKFAPAEIAKERDVILEEQSMYLDQPAEQVHDLLNEAQFPDHPLGRPVIGTPESVGGLRRADLTGFLESNYVTGTTVVAAAGCVEHDDVVRLVSRRAGDFHRGERARPAAPFEPDGTPKIRFFTKATEQTHIAIGFRTASRHDERRFALRLLNVILGENMSSRLFQSVREEHGLAYNIHSTGTAWSDCGDLVISAGLDDDKLEKALKLILKETNRLAENVIGKAEFGRVRDYALGQVDLALEGSEQTMMWLGEQMLGFGRITPPEETKRRLAAVTPAEVRNVARQFLTPGRLALALVTPRRSAKGLDRVLATG